MRNPDCYKDNSILAISYHILSVNFSNLLAYDNHALFVTIVYLNKDSK